MTAMELTRVSCANYKAFPGEASIEIRPLTILVGKNNAGKSVLTRLPVLLAHALSSGARRPLDLQVGEIDFGTAFVDLVHRQDRHGACSLGATFEEADEVTELRAAVQGVSHGGKDDAVVQRLRRQIRDSEPYLDVVEHPELPLHPAAHGGLADLFVESAKRPGARILLEIHSKAFLLRVRRSIAEEKIDPSKVALYWVEDLPEGNLQGNLSRLTNSRQH